MGRLKLDTDELRAAGSSLRLIAQEFDGADASSAAAAEAVGDPRLASRLEEFASTWDDRRSAMVESIAALAEACTGIGEGFDDLDREFAAALRGDV